MSDRQGFYSVIQFLPVPERFEFVNIGVVLFAPGFEGVDIKIDPDFQRIKKLFGSSDREKLSWLSSSLENRIRTEFARGWKQTSLERFAALRSGNIQMSQPLPILVKGNPRDALDSLFDEMVSRGLKQPRAQRAASVFKQRLVQAGVLGLVDQSPPEVELPQGFTIKVPFAYQNGSYNMIDPVRLEGSPEDALKNASSRAVEGRWLWRHSKESKRLVVVGDLSGQPETFASSLHEVMQENNVSFYELDEIDPLLDEIRRHGHVGTSTDSGLLRH